MGNNKTKPPGNQCQTQSQKWNFEASKKHGKQGLDDELWHHINMLGQTGRGLEKTQQRDKPRLNSNGTQTGERKRKNDYLCVWLITI